MEENFDLANLKDLISGELETHHQTLEELSLKIHSNPEMGLHEFKAVTWLTQHLKKHGFTIQNNICELPTAFRATYGQGDPAIALLAEYDALPKLGHACGHNIIATSAIGAAVAAKKAINQYGGSVMVIGTPAEELEGGKIKMAERGAFDNVDMTMLVHPGTHNTATTRSLACQTLKIEFTGKASHAAAKPEVGINALEAMILSYNAINSLRQHIRADARIHGIITDGGEAANIVPMHSAGTFQVRAEDIVYLENLKQRVLNCFIGGAEASGARLEYRWEETYAPMRNNLTMARLFQHNMQSLGRNSKLFDPSKTFGSTDMGNISQIVPSILPRVAIAPRGTSMHTPKFSNAAISADGLQGLMDASKALAMTVADVTSNLETFNIIKEELKVIG